MEKILGETESRIFEINLEYQEIEISEFDKLKMDLNFGVIYSEIIGEDLFEIKINPDILNNFNEILCLYGLMNNKEIPSNICDTLSKLIGNEFWVDIWKNKNFYKVSRFCDLKSKIGLT